MRTNGHSATLMEKQTIIVGKLVPIRTPVGNNNHNVKKKPHLLLKIIIFGILCYFIAVDVLVASK